MQKPTVPLAAVDRFQVSYGLNGVVLTLGQPYSRLDQQGLATAVSNWFSAISMSPQTAKQLRDITADFVERYEREHGPIPAPSLSVVPPEGESNVIALGGPRE